MTKIICITGAKRHGKGEVGNAIERLVPGTVQVGYADKLKISMMRSLGFVRPEAELIALADEAKVSWDISISKPYDGHNDVLGIDFERPLEFHRLTGRQLLQWFGTEGGRKTFGEGFWLDQVLPDPAQYTMSYWEEVVADAVALRYGNAPVVAITDCRFDNEAQRALDCGGEVWEVVRPDRADSSVDTHASEQGVRRSLITRTIINDGSLEDLQWRVEQALELAGAVTPS